MPPRAFKEPMPGYLCRRGKHTIESSTFGSSIHAYPGMSPDSLFGTTPA